MTPPEAQFDIVIVNWNAGDQLNACVDSIYRFERGLVAKIIIVDNASTDGSPELVAQGPKTDLARMDRNLGFAKACNVGAGRGSAPFIIFLNPDTLLFEGALEAVHGFMSSAAGEAHGLCGVQAVDESGRIHRDCAHFPTPGFYLAHSLGFHKLFPRLVRDHFMTEFDHRSSRAVDQAIGAFNAIRRELFEQLGGFDERFFVYMEDVDLALRAAQSGMPSYYLAEAKIFHRGGGTTRQIRATALFYNLRSRIIYAYKHFSGPAALAVLGSTLLTEFVSRMGQALLHRSWGDARSTASAYWMLWSDLGQIAQAVWRYRTIDNERAKTPPERAGASNARLPRSR